MDGIVCKPLPVRESRRLPRLVRRGLFVLWCVTWLPLAAFSLMETAGIPPETWQSVVRVIFSVSGLCFFGGGSIWLARKSRGYGWGRRIGVFLALFLFSTFGPVALLACASMLQPDGIDAADEGLIAPQRSLSDY